jgi:hypothetical protein
VLIGLGDAYCGAAYYWDDVLGGCVPTWQDIPVPSGGGVVAGPLPPSGSIATPRGSITPGTAIPEQLRCEWWEQPKFHALPGGDLRGEREFRGCEYSPMVIGLVGGGMILLLMAGRRR